MTINLEKISEIFGIDTINLIKENYETVTKNLKYLSTLGFTDINDIFERYALYFIQDHQDFVSKMNKLIATLGVEYIDIIENDLDYLEDLA